ncbi:hypothetical protein C1I95_19345 [Micromonospora craterilacus]|uniref:Uncharacterized protein n=1 Tax=Micromonospora craterilacus TaxID=1655439 RepID=A0A2W2EPN4_9ACTN|nr:hypothetical protein [Micromonospora craterilacus]PZG15560.1 hypothetical protein C1I95_19345 [Micromonospora craterilacus]
MSRSVAGEPPAAGRRAAPTTAGPYSVIEWELLTDLPGRVIVAAAQPGPGRPQRGVAAGLAGLDAVAAGRAFDSDLIRAVVAAIYARHDGAPSPAAQLTDLVEVLSACRAVVRVLDRRADPADSAAYRQWVQSVAARVCRAAPAVLPDGALAPADRRLLDRLGGALGLR